MFWDEAVQVRAGHTVSYVSYRQRQVLVQVLQSSAGAADVRNTAGHHLSCENPVL